MSASKFNPLSPVSRRFGWQLPPGVREGDCEPGRPKPAERWTARELWQACGASVQEKLSLQFAETSAELIRDAILDAQDAGGDPAAAASAGSQPAFVRVGEIIWRHWASFRDRALRDLVQNGDLSAV